MDARSERARGVFDDRVGGDDVVHRRGQPELVHDDDRRKISTGLFQRPRREGKGFGFHVTENRVRAAQGDGVGRGDEAVIGYRHAVAGTDAAGFQRREQRGRSGIEAHGERHAEVLRRRRLETVA
ncbi:MAG: hypothetical protein M5R36_09755 [Deltaproteobacteria bacterium]|nr:hypothetical protein [Deltaproteobacteria bacterium]